MAFVRPASRQCERDDCNASAAHEFCDVGREWIHATARSRDSTSSRRSVFADRRKKCADLWLQWRPSGRSDLRLRWYRPQHSITRARRALHQAEPRWDAQVGPWVAHRAPISLPRAAEILAQAKPGTEAKPVVKPGTKAKPVAKAGTAANAGTVANKPGEAAKAGTMEIGAVITTAAVSSSDLGFPMGMTTLGTTGRTTPMTTAMAPTTEIRATRCVAPTTVVIGTPAGCGSAADCPVTHIANHRGGDRGTPGHFSLRKHFLIICQLFRIADDRVKPAIHRLLWQQILSLVTTLSAGLVLQF
jgi:hypothetical protein